jgi:BirA family transcriptional regulator, biotin operon repressor / biotin---[acetyl-CoA-carboxylase] ligase
MDEISLRKALARFPLGGLRYFEQTASTNDIALAWAAAGAPDLALVYAEQQTAGRGRGAHQWFTPPGAALAFSLVLRPRTGETASTPRISALGALAVCEALSELGLQPEIKWPNDVLLNRRKLCGILAESVWMGAYLQNVILGIGLNVQPESVPPPEQLNFPATCLQNELPVSQPSQLPLDRAALLVKILQVLFYWRSLVSSESFLLAWEKRLAFRGEQVEIRAEGQPSQVGKLEGLGEDGSLRLTSPQGQAFSIQFGEVHLRPVV